MILYLIFFHFCLGFNFKYYAWKSLRSLGQSEVILLLSINSFRRDFRRMKMFSGHYTAFGCNCNIVKIAVKQHGKHVDNCYHYNIIETEC